MYNSLIHTRVQTLIDMPQYKSNCDKIDIIKELKEKIINIDFINAKDFGEAPEKKGE